MRERGRNQDETSIPEGAVKEERNLHPGRPQSWRGNHKSSEKKSTAAGPRRAQQKESHTDHWYHCPQTPHTEMLG